jgi:hypothetical protein
MLQGVLFYYLLLTPMSKARTNQNCCSGTFFVTFLLGHIENEKGVFKLVQENVLIKNIKAMLFLNCYIIVKSF